MDLKSVGLDLVKKISKLKSVNGTMIKTIKQLSMTLLLLGCTWGLNEVLWVL